MIPSFILYIIAVIIALALYFYYDETEEETTSENSKQPSQESESSALQLKTKTDFRFSSLFAVLGLNVPGYTADEQFESFTEHFKYFEEVSEACWMAGLESSSLLIGVDFSASNEWKGRKSFNQNCLHKLMGTKVFNPYQKVIWILGQTLAPFDDDNKIPAYGFGDTETKDQSVFPFKYDGSPCSGFQEVLEWYNEVVRRITLSGPSSFAPVIQKAIQTVCETKKYHILVIITDGQVTEEQATIEAIIEASNHPISIIAVGVGDGPWGILEKFDNQLPRRKFDNFRFVDYHKATGKSKAPDTAFALQALMEIPDQYKKIRNLGYLGAGSSCVQERKIHKLSDCPGQSPSRSLGGGSPARSAKPSPFRHRISNISC